MQRITVAGLGIIGSAWAQNLHADGLTVRGWNRSPKDLPFYEPDLTKAVADAELIIIVVADPPAVEAVLDVIVPVLKPGQIVVQSSTISAHWTKLFAQRVEGTGAAFLEAPFTGSKPAAEARKTVFLSGWFGGPYRESATNFGTDQRHAAARGRDRLGFLAQAGDESESALQMQALSESLTLARAAGISDETYFEALHMNVGRSGLSDLKESKLQSEDFEPQFSLKHMNKDLRLALETAEDIDLPTAKALKSFYDKGMESDFGDDDFIGVIRLLARKK